MSTLVNRVLLLDETAQSIERKLNTLQENDPKRLETLVGVCARLSLIDQIRMFSFAGSTQYERDNFLYQINRLSSYLTTTCIDILTGEHYQPYYQWLEEAYKSGTLGDTWDQAITELSKCVTQEKTASMFVKQTKNLHEHGYKETTSMRKAFKDFVSEGESKLKDWLLQNYIVEELNSNFEPKKNWQSLDDEKKCRNIAYYLYDLRNLYTHTVIPFQPMESVQHNNSNLPEKYQVQGFGAIFFPPTSKGEPSRRISLPVDKKESDVIRLLIIIWIRAHWLHIETDSESFLQTYWESRTK